MLTARMVKTVLDNLRDSELDLPVVFCICWYKPEQMVNDIATVTPSEIILHQHDDP